MQVIENEYVATFDVDETLVMHNDTIYDFELINPYSGSKVKLQYNKKHIELLKQFKGRGMYIVVWSAGGVLWAQTVINQLGLQDFVDMIITKPTKYVDDLTADQILGQRVYLK